MCIICIAKKHDSENYIKYIEFYLDYTMSNDLDVYWCRNLKSLEDIQSDKIHSIRIDKCPNLKYIRNISIKNGITCEFCPELEIVSNITCIQVERECSFSYNYKLRYVHDIKCDTLEITDCPELKLLSKIDVRSMELIECSVLQILSKINVINFYCIDMNIIYIPFIKSIRKIECDKCPNLTLSSRYKDIERQFFDVLK